MAQKQTDESTTVTVYQLYRGNRREDERAAKADDVRQKVRIENRKPTTADLASLYAEVGTETFSHSSTKAILGGMWQRWNAGSGVESQSFIEAEAGSMEIGDVVEFDGTYYVCASYSWEELDIDEADAPTALAVDVATVLAGYPEVTDDQRAAVVEDLTANDAERTEEAVDWALRDNGVPREERLVVLEEVL